MRRSAKRKRAPQESWLSAQRAWDSAIAITKTAELNRPVRERSYFSIAEIANGLARPAGLSVSEQCERDHLRKLLVEQANRGEFLDESGDPGAYVLRGEAPFFIPLKASPPALDAAMVIVVLDADETFLSRSATHRLLRESSLAAAPRFFKELFGRSETQIPTTCRLHTIEGQLVTETAPSHDASQSALQSKVLDSLPTVLEATEVSDPDVAIEAPATPKKGRGTDPQIAASLRDYADLEKDRSRSTNMDRAVAFVLARFPLAGRDRVRYVYRDEVGHKQRGRPGKSRP